MFRNKLKRVVLAFGLLMVSTGSFGQQVFEHVSNYTIYDYLDEMANLGLIDLNSAAKPYSRMMIREKLVLIQDGVDKLNKRQAKELEFYMKDYVKEARRKEKTIDFLGKGLRSKGVFPFKNRSKRYDLFFYSDTLFTVSLNPIFGGTGWYNANGPNYHRWIGAEMFGYVWNVGFYGNIRDNSEYDFQSDAMFLTQRSGNNAKIVSKRGREYDEARGGITVSYKGVTLGVIKDNIVWGNNYNGSNIYGARNPSFPMIFLQIKPLKWFEINYFHGWLSSNVLDSAASVFLPTGNQKQFVPKYIAANLYTIRPFKKFHLSVGNSVIYSEHINPAYFIPFLFWKSVDHGDAGNTNSQMFFDISTRNIPKNHLSFTMFFDELNISNMLKSDRHTNWWSLKGSWRYSNFLPNFTFTAEYTYTNPMAYKHFIPTTTYTNSSYNMGHYLRDNAQEIFVRLDYRPLPRLQTFVHFIYALKGDDYVDDRTTIDPNTGQLTILGLPFQDHIIWKKSEVKVGATYELVNGLHVALDYTYAKIMDVPKTYTAPYLLGAPHMVAFRLNYGF